MLLAGLFLPAQSWQKEDCTDREKEAGQVLE
jgi:hypothetical protein